MTKLRLVAWEEGIINDIQEGNFGPMGLHRKVTELMKRPSVVSIVVTRADGPSPEEKR